jgi:16S rRNA (cytosine967-C5)-methyltransferase
VKRLEGSADRVLLDVPCSGLGVLRRNPDAKWKLKPSEMENLRKLQADILRLYSQMVKPAGKLVYATCSLLPSENGAQVKAFLAAHEGKWQLEAEESFLPKEGSGDGFYYARLGRT